MNRFIAIYPSRCVACGTCRAACSEGHKRAGLQKEPRLALYESRDVVASLTCHHCEGAPCVKVCPVNAIKHEDDGCVRVDESHCIGRAGVAGIEYNTPTFAASLDPILQWEIGVSPVAVKCDLCKYDGCKPHCVDACITEALTLIETDGTEADLEAKRKEALEAGLVMLEDYEGRE